MQIWNLRCTEVYMVRHEFNLWGLQAHLTPTVHCSLQRCLVLGSACTILALQTSLLIAIGWHDQLLNTSFAGPNIYLVRIKLKLHSEDWELRLRWVSSVLGWTGVAGHLHSGWTESVFWDSRFQARPLLTESKLAEAISRCRGIGADILI